MMWMYSPDIQDVSPWDGYPLYWFYDWTQRTGTHCIYLDDNGDYLMKYVPAANAYYARAAFRIAGSNDFQIRFYDDTTCQVTVALDISDAKVKAYRSTGTLLGESSQTGVAPGEWHVLEVYVVIHDTAGIVTAKVDGTVVLSLTSQDTCQSGSNEIDKVYFWVQGGINNGVYMDDFMICDDDWPGLGGVLVQVPNANGSNTNWTPTGGDNYTNVDEKPPSSSDTVSADSSVSGVKDTYGFENLAATPGSIRAVGIIAKTYLDDSGAGSVRAIALSNGTYGNGDDLALSVSAQWVELWMTVDPDTSTAWTESGVNALEGGVETR